MKTNLGIVIPVRNCLELTKATIESIKTRFPYKIYIIDDHSDNSMKEWLKSLPDITLFTDPPDSSGLAANWNLGIAAALNDDCSHILVINNDILLHPMCIDAMVARYDKGDVVMVSGYDIHNECLTPQDVFMYEPKEKSETEHPDFACFLIGDSTIRKVGWFDENYIGAYYEDNDYHAHIAVSSEKAVKISWATFYHYGGSTFSKNPETALKSQHYIAHNSEYFQYKWGNKPTNRVEEMRASYHPCPFNQGVCLAEIADISEYSLNYLYKRISNAQISPYDYISYLYRLASTVTIITAFTSGNTIAAGILLCAKPSTLIIFDECIPYSFEVFSAMARYANIAFQHNTSAYSADHQVKETDLLYIDCLNIKDDLNKILSTNADKVNRYIAVHNGNNNRDMQVTLSSFLGESDKWYILQHLAIDNDLIILARKTKSGI